MNKNVSNGAIFSKKNVASMLLSLAVMQGDMNQVSAQYDYGPLVNMADYSKNYRTTDCFECFEARGKFCHSKTYGSMMSITGSSNYGHGLCCKPDYNGANCNSDSSNYCSEPSYFTNTTAPDFNIVSEGSLDHQLYAFCTLTSQ